MVTLANVDFDHRMIEDNLNVNEARLPNYTADAFQSLEYLLFAFAHERRYVCVISIIVISIFIFLLTTF